MIKPYLQLVRAPNGLTAMSNIVAAAVIVTAGQLPLTAALLVFASLCFYYGGMALNDCFDYQEDLRERPDRPLPSGQISKTTGWAIGFGLLAVGLVLCALANLNTYLPLLIGAALCCSIVGYNRFVKDGMSGSIVMALCRYFNWLLGLSAITLVSASFDIELALIALPIFFYICGLTYISKQETLAENRSAMTVLLILLILTGLSVFSLIWIAPALFNGSPLITFALAAGWLSWLLFHFVSVWRDFTPTNIQRLVMILIIGVIPLDALLVALSGQYIWSAFILALLPICRKMSQSLYMT